ncbi:MAG: hypothetical protein JW940_37405, partial [Polyangiaceae bacterium]|nr:hypothetical protein [Polyangiaceae bacterium]
GGLNTVFQGAQAAGQAAYDAGVRAGPASGGGLLNGPGAPVDTSGYLAEGPRPGSQAYLLNEMTKQVPNTYDGLWGPIGEGMAIATDLAPMPAGPGKVRLLARFGAWLKRVLRIGKAAEAVARGTTVLGHHPEYLERAAELGARRFNIPTRVWNKMSAAEQWAANQRFLDRLIARGDRVVLSTPAAEARAGSFFARELQYLKSHGYTLNPQGTMLLPP